MTFLRRIELRNNTIIEIRSGRPGTSAVIMAGVHGNERCGVIACESLLRELRVVRGQLTIIYANKEALRLNQRQVEYNLNRCFLKEQPEEVKRTLEGETARTLMLYLDKADVLLDIHASYALHSEPFVICDERNLEAAKILPAAKVLVNIDAFHPGSTDAYMNLQGKPAFCMECGHLDDPNAVTIAEEAIRRFLIQQGLLVGTSLYREQKGYKAVRIYKNLTASFNVIREFKDFEKIKATTLIGHEGGREVFAEIGDVLLFVRNAPELNQECFLVAREIHC